MNLEDKNLQTCQLAVVNRGQIFLRAQKEHFIQSGGHYLSHLEVESALGPKIKYVVLHSNLNFYERSNFISSPKIIISPWSKQHHDKP